MSYLMDKANDIEYFIELDGAIKQEGDCFNGENFHLEKYNDEWLLKKGNGCNNISAIWYDQNKTAENLEVIPWTYKTEIPHQFFWQNIGEKFFVKDLYLGLRI